MQQDFCGVEAMSPILPQDSSPGGVLGSAETLRQQQSQASPVSALGHDSEAT